MLIDAEISCGALEDYHKTGRHSTGAKGIAKMKPFQIYVHILQLNRTVTMTLSGEENEKQITKKLEKMAHLPLESNTTLAYQGRPLTDVDRLTSNATITASTRLIGGVDPPPPLYAKIVCDGCEEINVTDPEATFG